MGVLRDFNLIRNVEWGSQYLWDISFGDGPPAPFDAFFPAVDVVAPIFGFAEYTVTMGALSFDIPSGMTPEVGSVTFIDDAQCTMEQWCIKWAKKAVNHSNFTVGTISEIARTMTVQRLDKERNVIHTTTYVVAPKGEMQFQGSSEAGFKILTLNLSYIGLVSDTMGRE